MAIDGLSVITSNITVVSPDEIDSTPSNLNQLMQTLSGSSEVFVEETPFGKKHMVVNWRAQLKISIEPKRVALIDDTGRLPGSQDTQWFSSLIDALEILDVSCTSYGFNYEMEFPSGREQGSGALIAKSLVNQDIAEKLRAEMIGAGVRFQVVQDHTRYTYIIEPRFQRFDGTDVFCKLNAHFGTGELPEVHQLQVGFRDEFQKLIQAMETLLDLPAEVRG